MDAIAAYIPDGPGLLPKWLLFVAVVATSSGLSAFKNIDVVRRIYTARPQDATHLTSHLFGTWNLLSAVVRAYAAYNISNPVAYDLCMWTYVLAAVHFTSEWLVFGAAAPGAPGFITPMIVANGSLTWMLTQRSFYL